MSARAEALQLTAADQLDELAARAAGDDLSRTRKDGLALGDGTVAVTIEHVADVYVRLAAFVAGDKAERTGGGDRRHEHGTADGSALPARIAAAQEAVRAFRALSDEQLDAVPPDGAFRFCDGKRTLEQVLEGVIRHQQHHVDATRS